MIDISEGIKLFNDSDFFSAHDFFEDIWMEVKQEEKDFFQGLVQISVGCYHLICGNFIGSVSQLTKGKEKLNKYKPDYYKININSLVISIDLLLNKINRNSDYRDNIPIIELLK